MEPYREDVRQVYNIVMNNFCKKYYDTYDNNFDELHTLYTNNSMFTYLDEELVGFNDYRDRIKSYGIFKFNHSDMSANSQPIGSKTLLISITGHLQINTSSEIYRFSETIILQREKYNNNYFVYNTIFKLID